MTTTATAPAARRLPWDVMGSALSTPDADVTTALIANGLDYDTRMVEFQVPGTDGMLDAPKHRAVVRPGPGGMGERVIGVTGTRFTPIQNRDAFSVGDVMRQEYLARITGAADYHDGTASLLVLAMGEGIHLALPNGKDDRVDLNLLIKNTHDGSGALTFALTAVRVECTNAVQAAIADAQRVWKVSHTPNAQERVDLARQSIVASLNYAEGFQAKAQAMINQTMTDLEFTKIISGIWAVKDGDESKAAQNRLAIRDQVRDLYHDSSTLEGARGTLWGGYNAITEWYDWSRPVRGGEVYRAEGALEGAYVRAKANVWDRFAAAVA